MPKMDGEGFVRCWRSVMVAVAVLGGLAACAEAPPLAPVRSAAAIAPRPRPRPPPAEAELRPERLTGLSRDQALALLGPPSAETTRDMATVWSYRRGGCALSLTFYPEVQTAVERVLGYEFADGRNAVDCLRRLRAAGTRHER